MLTQIEPQLKFEIKESAQKALHKYKDIVTLSQRLSEM